MIIRKNGFKTVTHDENSVVRKRVGRIDYLDRYGFVAESVEYTDEGKFISDIREENFFGVPMTIVLYRDENGKMISRDFLVNLDPIVMVVSEEDAPQ